MTRLKLVLSMTAAMLVAGLLVWKAEATPLTAATAPLAAGKTHSDVLKAGCIFGTSRCPAGTKWSCRHTMTPSGERKFCHCRPC
jgi:hypothetical protein